MTHLILFVSGATSKAAHAEANLRRTCDAQLDGGYQVTVIDVLKQPEAAEEYRVVVTPTVIRVSPSPNRRVIGDLTDSEQLIYGLGLDG